MSSRIAPALALVALAALASCSGPSKSTASGAAGPADSATGKVYGEFEDASRFARSRAAHAEMRAWTEKEVFDGLSGATIQAKTFGRSVPDREVLLDGKLLAYADGFGQYWLALPSGTYELVGRCEGYRDAKARVIVTAGASIYANFYLEAR